MLILFPSLSLHPHPKPLKSSNSDNFIPFKLLLKSSSSQQTFNIIPCHQYLLISLTLQSFADQSSQMAYIDPFSYAFNSPSIKLNTEFSMSHQRLSKSKFPNSQLLAICCLLKSVSMFFFSFPHCIYVFTLAVYSDWNTILSDALCLLLLSVSFRCVI